MKDKQKELKDITFKFNDSEIALFKNTFCEKTMLLRIVSNAFLQLELTQTDKDILKNTFEGKAELMKLMRKKLIAELDPNTPLGLNSDIWKEIKTDNLPPEMVMLDMKAKRLVLDLLEEGLKIIENPNYEPSLKIKELVAFDDLSNPNDVYVNIKARNDFMMHLNAQMFSILGLAGRSNETIESIKTRLAANSSK